MLSCQARTSPDSGSGPGRGGGEPSLTVTVSVEYDVSLVRTCSWPWSCSICDWMVSSCSCTASTSPTVVALARIVRYCCRLTSSAAMRDCRSTYWPVTSVALVVRSDVLPSAWACLSTAEKLATGTWSVTLP